MAMLIISGPAHAFAKNPRSSKPINDRITLARFHGLASEEGCADIFDDKDLNKLGLSGGRLRFVLDEKRPALRIVTAFHVSRRLTDEESQRVVEATKAQWSDGCGSGSFENFHGTVLSTAHAIALLNSGESKNNIGEYFVDAYPQFAEDEETRVEFSETGVEKTDLDFLQEAAELGEPHAQFELARQLQDGQDIKKNERLAFQYYQKAAEQGHELALTFLGLCFQNGTGTPQALERGFECFAKAAEKGLPLAMHCLGECFIEGRGVEANAGEGIKWYRRGVKIGDVGCTAELADCYEFGKAVPQDLRQALELYERCIEGGFDAVKPALKRVKKALKTLGEKKGRGQPDVTS